MSSSYGVLTIIFFLTIRPLPCLLKVSLESSEQDLNLQAAFRGVQGPTYLSFKIMFRATPNDTVSGCLGSPTSSVYGLLPTVVKLSTIPLTRTCRRSRKIPIVPETAAPLRNPPEDSPVGGVYIPPAPSDCGVAVGGMRLGFNTLRVHVPK